MKQILLLALFAFAITMNAQNRHERTLRHEDGPIPSSSINRNITSALPRHMGRKAPQTSTNLLCDSIVHYDRDGEKYVITEYTYDKNGNLICRKDSFHLDGDIWYYNYMEEYTYDERGNNTSYSESSRTNNQDWSPSYKFEYMYNDQKEWTCRLKYYWQQNSGWYVYYKAEMIYDAQGLCTGCLYYKINWDTNDWDLYGKETTTYDDQGNESGYKYEIEYDGIWYDDEIAEYKYDAQGNITRESYYYSQNYEWIEYCRYEYTYDEKGNRILFITYSGQNKLELDTKYEYTYDAQGNITSRKTYDYSDGEWKANGSAICYYSSHGAAIEYKIGDTFEYISGENTLFCRIIETANEGRGKVDIVGENNYWDGPTQNYFSAEKQPKGKLVVPAVVTDANGDKYDVETIASNTYYNCRSLKELDLNCKTLGDAAFSFCEYIEKVTLGDNVTTFYPRPFFRTYIKSINLNKVTEMYCYDGQPFDGCSILEEIIVPEDNPAFVAVDNVLYSKDMTRLITFPTSVDYATWSGFPEGLQKIEPYAFIYLNTNRVEIPASLGDIKYSYSSAFANCTVDELYINGKYVPTAAFSNSDIKAVHFGSDVEFVGQINFTGFYTTDIYLHGTSLPDWEYDSTSGYASFKYCFDATLHVMPDFDLPAKIAADTNKWANFTNVVEDIAIPEDISTINYTDSSAASTIYNLCGQQVNSTFRGIQIKNGKKYLVK